MNRAFSKLRNQKFNNNIVFNFAKKKNNAKAAAAAQKEEVYFGKTGSTLKMGIVGMANVGKSTTFNLLTKQQVPAENFPFCTIDPNTAIVQVPDSRFEKLCELYDPVSQVGPTIQITDIAGLVKGASEGEGLGNDFLNHIKQVDGIFQVVRAFEKDSIVHTEGFMDPIRDLNIIKEELMLKDMAFLDTHVVDLNKKAQRSKNPDQVQAVEAMKKAQQYLNEGKWLRYEKWTNTEVQSLNKLHLLSAKPITYLINQSKKDYLEDKCKFESDIQQWINETSKGESQMIKYSAELELENTNQEKMNSIVENGYRLLNLIHYFTVGKDECRCWTIRKNSKAPQAASAIHTDFEKGFISAEVLAYNDFIKEKLDRVQKKFRKEGKEYIVQDGDIIHFKCKISK